MSITKLTAIKTMLHGLSRGIIARIQGGSFRAGFFSGLSSALDVGTKGYGGFVGRTMIMAIVGGTAAAIGGGKFANGAISGAFVHMFNAEAMKFIRIRNLTERLRQSRALAMMQRLQQASFIRGVPSIGYAEAYDRILQQEAFNDTMNRVLIAGAGGLLMTPVAEAGYALAMSYPLETMAGIGVADNLFMGGTPPNNIWEYAASRLHDYNPWAVK